MGFLYRNGMKQWDFTNGQEDNKLAASILYNFTVLLILVKTGCIRCYKNGRIYVGGVALSGGRDMKYSFSIIS